jgi:hypothetical protein
MNAEADHMPNPAITRESAAPDREARKIVEGCYTGDRLSPERLIEAIASALAVAEARGAERERRLCLQDIDSLQATSEDAEPRKVWTLASYNTALKNAMAAVKTRAARAGKD